MMRHLSALERVRAVALGCTRCDLSRSRTQVVYGEGDPHASLMIVGEAPGEQEDRSGRPFRGVAGTKLDSLLAEIGLDRSGVYIANVVMCRPPSNRRPRRVEVEECASHLDAQIRLVAPIVILALGAAPTKRLLGRHATVTASRGRTHEVGGLTVVSTFHPSPLSINRAPERQGQMRADFRLAKSLLATIE